MTNGEYDLLNRIKSDIKLRFAFVHLLILASISNTNVFKEFELIT